MSEEPFKVIGDLYNRIFTVQSSHLEVKVDYLVWNQIFANLPKDYKLPDIPVLQLDRPFDIGER
ncbi:hypothetical protein [Paenibacillus sp. Y412MC10]|uniref:hypothetical protein n=1 Tax=Geobacillus sp. (strain Y412MC10) TaxID=481743 RepID=UPI000CF85AA7|nr:hypothetical protein [Paenibacillus sp. Y412MC10]PQP85677.1 hypothetical protein CPT76_34325 [Paenibacillus sp. AR247]GIO64541.1 hypothetical protein J43TS9_61150 [Paenibacillus cineris]